MFTLCSFSKLVDYLFFIFRISRIRTRTSQVPHILTFFSAKFLSGSTLLIDHSNCQYNSDHSDLTMGGGVEVSFLILSSKSDVSFFK